MTPQERAEQVVYDMDISASQEVWIESIRAAIVEATNAEVERRREAEAVEMTLLEFIHSRAAIVRQMHDGGDRGAFCSWCGNPSMSRDEAREHVATCRAHPAVQRLVSKVEDIEQALRAIAGYRYWFDTCTKTDQENLAAAASDRLNAAVEALRREPLVTV